MTNDMFYQGFEGEGEICFISGENKMILWEGYFLTILDNIFFTAEKGGMLEAYTKCEGWYDGEPWRIEDVAMTIRQLSCFDEKNPELPTWKEMVVKVKNAIVAFLRENEPEEIFIEYN